MSFEDAEQQMFYLERKEFERLVRKNITHARWLQIQDSERYLKTLFERTPLSQMTNVEKKRVAALIKREDQDIWDLLLSACVGEAIRDLPELSHEQRQAFAWNRAEVLMIQEFRIPPHYTKEAKCRQCGPVLLPESAVDVAPVSCPWCAVGLIKGLSITEEIHEQ